LFVLLFFNSVYSFAHFDFSPAHQKAYQQLLYMQVPLVEKNINTLDKKNGCTISIKNTLVILKLLANDSPQLYDSLKALESTYQKELKKQAEKSPYYHYYEAEMKLYWAFVHLNYGNEVAAFIKLKSVKSIIEANTKNYPDFLPNKKVDAIIQLILGSIPGEYKWITDNLGLKGSHYKGISLLNEIIDSNHCLKDEALLLKSMSYIFLQQDYYLGLSIVNKLQQKHPKSLLYNFILVNTLLFKHDNEKALEIIKKKPKGNEYVNIPQYTYFTAECFLQKLELQTAEQYYQQFLKKYTGKNHRKSSYFKLYLIETMRGNRSKADYYINQIDTKHKSNTYPDKYAVAFAKNPENFHPKLIKVRLLQDGGYYSRALKILLDTKTSIRRDILEKEYRLARVYHFTGKTVLAKEHYKTCINKSRYDDGWYYAPNSCLQLGYIYEYYNKDLAKSYYQKALKYSQHPYKNGIDDRAKKGINRLK